MIKKDANPFPMHEYDQTTRSAVNMSYRDVEFVARNSTPQRATIMNETNFERHISSQTCLTTEKYLLET